jgi:hypothetical protein
VHYDPPAARARAQGAARGQGRGMLLRLVGAAGSRALAWPFSKLWRCGGCAGSGGTVWSSVRACGIALQVSRAALGPRVPGGVAGAALGVAVTSSACGWAGRSVFPISASDSTSVYLRLIGTLERVRSSHYPVSYCRAPLKR